MKTHKITNSTPFGKPYSYYVDVAGPAPEGYRWLAEHEIRQKGDLQAMWSGEFCDLASYSYGSTGEGYLPSARPITPEPKKSPMPTHPSKTLKYKIVTSQNGLVAAKITEQSHRWQEFGIKDNHFGALRSSNYPEHTKAGFYVRGVEENRDDDLMLFTDSQFKEFEKEVAAYNSHFSKPAVLRTVFFEYSAGSVRGYRRVEVIREDETYLEGIDSKKGSYRRFLKSKIVGPVDTVKA